MAEFTKYMATLPGYPESRLMLNKGGQFYIKPITPHGSSEHRFPREIDIADDLQTLGYCRLRNHGERTPLRDEKPVTGKPSKPAEKPKPESKPITADKPAPQPQEKEPVNDGIRKSKFDLFKL